MGAVLTLPASKLSKTNFRSDAFVFYVLAVKKDEMWCYKSSWLLFIVSWIPTKSWMWTNSRYQQPSIFSKEKVWNVRRGKLFGLLMVNAEKWDAKIKKWGRCQFAIAMCCQSCLPNFQCFQSCVSWTPLCIFSFCYVSNAVVSGTYPWVAVS